MIAVLVSSVLMAVSATATTTEAEAAEASRFQAGNIVSDANFYNGSAMSAAQVQEFLDAQLPSCDSGYTCLNRYAQATPTMAANRYCSAYAGSASETAASMLSRVALHCNISPRVLLVLLQKEQSLVTDRNPTPRQYSAATGFACPDTAPCDSSYGGFFYQLYYAARQFQVYKAFPTSFNHQPNAWNNVLYHPNAACGSGRVYVSNFATAGLYNYTPYQPNSAALGNLYGTGDSCSSYGNRNFWRMWTDWFGSPNGPSGPPFGAYDSLTPTDGGAIAAGWAIDPDTRDPIEVHAYVDGAGYAPFVANVTRNDVGAVYPDNGPTHGFRFFINMTAGQHEVCLFAMDKVAPGGTTSLGCKTVTVTAGGTGMHGPPIGAIDSVVNVADDRVSVAGWAADPDSSASIQVHIYVDGRYATQVTANRTRNDVARTYPQLGAAHGFSTELRLSEGTHGICFFGIDVRGGETNQLLHCRDIAVAGPTGGSGPPIGALDVVEAVDSTTLRIAGWTIDPDTSQSIATHIYVDGRGVVNMMADGTRADVGRHYSRYGSAHGFSATVQVGPGTHSVCVFGIDAVGDHGSTLLRCTTITMPGSLSGDSPVGSLDLVQPVAGGVRVGGWSIDPNTTASTDVHVWSAAIGTSIVADRTRNDVARVYPAYGAQHGFEQVIPLPSGSREVCVFAINEAGAGGNVLLGCRVVTIP